MASQSLSQSSSAELFHKMVVKPGRKRRSRYIPFPMKVLFSGASTVSATLVTHPFDVVKVLFQVHGQNKTKGQLSQSPFRAIAQSIESKGPGILYNGLTAAVARQLSYGSARLAIFDSLMTSFESKDGTPPSFDKKLVFSAIAGGIGAIIGNPADMTLVRMAADSRLPPESRRNYTNVIDALSRIRKEEGILAWWKGATPTVARCIVVNVSQLTTYAQAKQEILRRGYIKEDGLKCHVVSSMIAGLVATFATQPVDVVKTRLQNMKGEGYTGVTDCFSKIIRNEGPTALWKGFFPAYARMAPQTTITFVLLEMLKKSYSEAQ